MSNSIASNTFSIGRRGPTWYSQPWWGGESLATRQYSLLRLLSVGHRERLDIVPLIAGLAAEHRGYYRHVLRTLASRIENGVSLVSALEQTPDALSDDDVLALRLAGESGTWTATFNELLKVRGEEQQANRLHPKFSVAYWLALVFMMYLILTLLIAVVAPTFIMMGNEMGVPAPDAFKWLYRSSNPVSLGWLLLLIIVLTTWFSWFRAPRRFFTRRVAPQLFPPIAQRQIVELFRVLATALESGRPLGGALSTLARYHYNRRLRHRLLYARNEVEQGADPWQSLANSHLIHQREADALSHSPNKNIGAWTLRELARKKFIQASRRTAGLAALVEPALTLLFGGIVLWICFSFFQYLVSFISRLA